MSVIGFLREVAEALWSGVKAIWNAAVKIVKAIVDFFADCVNWLSDWADRLFITKDSPQKPIMVDWNKLMEEARTEDVGIFNKQKRNIGVGFFNTQTKQVEHMKNITADKVSDVDEQLKGDPLVILN